MDFFNYKDGELYSEDVPAEKIAREVGTPAYVYSKATFLHHYRQIAEAFAPLNPTICYSIKSCGNIHILRLLREEGCGFDVTSGGELFRALKTGADPKKIIYAGVGKTDEEIADGINAGIAAFNLESEAEIENIDRIATSLGKTAVGAIRINPDVDPKTHVKTTTGKKETKFGVDIERAERVFARYGKLKHLRVAGVHMHIGSPVYEIRPYVEAVNKITALVDDLIADGHKIEWFDLGGGFAVNYEGPDQARPVTEHARALIPLLKGKPYHVALEPGRYIAGNSGILLTRVLYRKTGGEKKFVIVDAGMNDLLRPTLYESYHHIWPVKPDAANLPPERSRAFEPRGGEVVDVVGPICESGDYLAKNRPLPMTQRGDLLAVFTAGAYGFAMSSNYNNRPRAPEVLVDGDSFRVIRRRETLEDLVAPELVQEFTRMASANIVQLMRSGLDRHRAGQLAEAGGIYRQILAENPRHVDAMCLLGMIARQQGKPDEAAEMIQRALAIDPNKAEAHHSLGDAQRSRGKLEEAAAAYGKAVQLKPGWAEAHGALGDVLRELGRFDQAVEQYNAVIRMKPNLAAGYLNLGRALQGRGRHADAIAAYQKAIPLNPQWAEAYEGLAHGLTEAGRLDEAITAFKKSLELKPGLFTAEWGLGKVLVMQGKEAESLACYERATKSNPGNAHAHFYLACRLVKAGRLGESAVEYREAIRLKPDSPDWKYQLAAVSGDRTITKAPAQYVRNLFDFYAPKFDKHLVEKLKYQTPKLLLTGVLEATQAKDMDVLDLGCGTGLCGVEFKPYARRLVGVDLSSAMVKVAESRGIYDQLTTGDLMPVLTAAESAYDLILAGDVLVYVGDLSEFMPAVSRALRAGGILGCSIEDYTGEGFFLHPEERFAHSIKYFRDLAAASGLKEISANKVVLRHNKGVDVFGWTLVFGKR